MAHKKVLLVAVTGFLHTTNALTTCPGFPGYCSESFPGQTCNVVCSFGRNNVPLCQDDGTWTDIPRCVEHEPGVEEQIPGLCPAIPGYCSQGFLNQRCQFDCRTGADIDSICSSDGTWLPFPVCDGDLRETRDGCDGCPGPLGGARNRTAEAILGINNDVNKSRVPRIGSVDGSRKKIPTFAGATSFGVKESIEDNSGAIDNIILGSDGRIQQVPQQKPFQPQQPFQPRQQPQQPRPQQSFQQPRPQVAPQPQQQPQPRPQFPFSQPTQVRPQAAQALPSARPAVPPTQPAQPVASTLFNQIRTNINNQQQAGSRAPQQSPTSLPVQSFFPENSAATPGGPAVGSDQTFGPFEAVAFQNALSGSQRQRPVPSRQPSVSARPAVTNSQFFGEFQQVNLQGRRRR